MPCKDLQTRIPSIAEEDVGYVEKLDNFLPDVMASASPLEQAVGEGLRVERRDVAGALARAHVQHR